MNTMHLCILFYDPGLASSMPMLIANVLDENVRFAGTANPT